MKWLLMLAVFVGGIFYLVNQKKEDARKEEIIRQQKADEIKMSEPSLPQAQEKSSALKFTQQTLTTLRGLTGDSNEKVRIASAELLWQMQDEQVEEIIRNMLETETEPATKAQLIDILVQTKTVKSLNLITEALKDSDKDIRIKAVEAIGSFGTKEAIPALNHAMKDYDEEVRFKALKAVDSIRKDIESLKQKQLEELKAKKEAEIKVQ